MLVSPINKSGLFPLTKPDLLEQLAKATGPDGTVGEIGQIVVDWVRSRLKKNKIKNSKLLNIRIYRNVFLAIFFSSLD